jgi:outer membrane protein assembly factor BamB
MERCRCPEGHRVLPAVSRTIAPRPRREYPVLSLWARIECLASLSGVWRSMTGPPVYYSLARVLREGWGFFAFLAIGLSVLPSNAQLVLQPGNGTPTAEEDAGPGNFPPPDRNLVQALNRAQKVLKEHRYGEALEGISQILRGGEDYLFQPDRTVAGYKSLKLRAQQLLGQMPREGLDLYEVRYGGEARDKLKRAVAAGDKDGLSEISSQLFHTRAGYEATWLLALYHMDHGAPLAGALTLKRLREAGAAAESFEPGLSLTEAACYYQAGMLSDCKQVLIDLKRRMQQGPGSRQQGAGSQNYSMLHAPGSGLPVPWFDSDADAPNWLAKLAGLERIAAGVETDRWSMFRGDAARNAATVGSPPLLNRRWRVEVAEDPVLQKALEDLANSNREHGVPMFAGLHPLAIGDKILMRTRNNVMAIDLTTGKRIWPTASEHEPGVQQSNRQRGFPFNQASVMSEQAQYAQRIWDDAAYGTLSSDGSLVYLIEELPLGVTPNNGQVMMFGGNRTDPSNHGATNKLAAYDINTAKLMWSVGGQEDPMGMMPDTFFLGPPLPLRGQLYVMAEVKEEMRLLAFNATSGSFLWSQPLANVESNITQDAIRRLAGVSPSYSDGVLICPTGAGCVVAVDVATHSLLWGYIYTRPGEQPTAGRRFRGQVGGNAAMLNAFYSSNGVMPRWLDGTAMIVGGRVLLTPAEADALYCLNLADGKPMWPAKPREDHCYIACVHKGLVVLVGRTEIDAIKLEDGSKAWGGRTVTLPSGASVCGHGCYAGDHYFVPLSNGDVMSVDLESGKVVSTSPGSRQWTGRRSAVPGNLICYRGFLISQGMDGLECYYQVDAARDEVARRLTANPDDIEGLTLRGEMLLDAGKPGAAVADFRRAYNLDKKAQAQSPGMGPSGDAGHGRTRELLRDALLTGLHDDFAAHRSMAGEIEQLLDDPPQRATYFRCMAAGLQEAREWQKSIDYLLKLADLEEAKTPQDRLEKVDRSHLVRRDCWIQARLGMLRLEGGAAAAAEIDRIVENRLEAAKKDTGCEGLQRFLALFGNQPQAAAARTELRDRMEQAGRLMDAEMLTAAAVSSSSGTNRKEQAGLLAEMAALDLRAGHISDAAACVRQLQQEFPDVLCFPPEEERGNDRILPAGARRSDREKSHAPTVSGSHAHSPPGGTLSPQGKTAEQWLAAYPKGDALRREVRSLAPAWPAGEVKSSQPDNFESPYARTNRYEMTFGGPRGPFFTDCNVSWDYNQQAISFRDGLGEQAPQMVRLADNGLMYNPNSAVVRSCGHLLVVSVGTKIFALDPFKVSGKQSPILWFQNLVDPTADGQNMGNPYSGDRDFRMNPFGPVNSRYVAFVRRQSIIAVDPMTGDPLWIRQDIPHQSEVFGDEQYMFVLPAGSDEASVYRAIDGQLLGTRKVPRSRSGESFANAVERGASPSLPGNGFEFFGRYILRWEQGPDNNGRVLTLFDPWLQKAVWPSFTFASGSCVSVVENEAVGVLEPRGRFVLLGLADGHTIADLTLEARQGFHASDLLVRRMGDQYIVLAHDNRMLGNGMEEQRWGMAQGMSFYPIRRARIYALTLGTPSGTPASSGANTPGKSAGHGVVARPAWPAPVDVDHQQLLLSQPGRLPVLIFASFHYDQNRMVNGNANNMRTSLVAVDRRNGRIVYDNPDLPGQYRNNGFEIRGEPSENMVRIATNNRTVNLKFTDEPVKAIVRQSTGVKKPRGKLGEALLDAVQNAIGTH